MKYNLKRQYKTHHNTNRMLIINIKKKMQKLGKDKGA